MKAFIADPNNNGKLLRTQLPIPSPKENEALIRVTAAGVNRPDILQRNGLYPPPPGASPTLGLEIAGQVIKTGNNVTDLREGDKVCALLTGGGYADYAIADASLCLPIPEGVNEQHAAALPETFFTVWSNLVDRAHLQAEERVVVHGGSSGIGVAAIQLAKWLGATVLTTVGSDEKCHYCKNLGADYAINYKTNSFVDEFMEITEQQGVDVILDIVGAAYLSKNIGLLREEGRLIQIAMLSGVKAEINLLPFLLKRITLTGSALRSRSVDFKSAIARQLKQTIWPEFIKGNFSPCVNHEYPMEDALQAHQLMESSQHTGKILLIN